MEVRGVGGGAMAEGVGRSDEARTNTPVVLWLLQCCE